MFNISEFAATIDKINGVTKTNHFMMMITPPPWSLGENSEYLRNTPYLIHTSALPGIGMTTFDIAHAGYGVFEKRPYQPIFNDINVEIYNDGNGKGFEFFHKWMQNIVNFYDGDTTIGNPSRSAHAYEVHYKDNYATTIEIIHYNSKSQQVIAYILNEAHPVAVGDIAVSWMTGGSVVSIPVSLTYRSWHSQVVAQTDITSLTDNRRFSLIKQIAGNGTLGTAIQRLSNSTSINDALAALRGVVVSRNPFN